MPERIVSTSPSITETLFALGLGDRVVGVSSYCRFPEEAGALPKIGTFLHPSAELIARAEPDLTILHRGPSGIERQLEALGIPFLVVERGSLESVFTTIRAIGERASSTDRAAALIGSIEKRLAKVREAVSGRTPTRVLIIVGRRSGTLTDLVAAGRRSYLSDLVAIAGGMNVLESEGLPEYPRISMETVIRLAPEVVIDAGDMGDSADERERRSKATEELWKVQPLPASKTRRVHAVTSDAMVVPGPRLVEAAETIALWLHGVKIP